MRKRLLKREVHSPEREDAMVRTDAFMLRRKRAERIARATLWSVALLFLALITGAML